ncbi:MAG: sodium:proton antiporter, partial [Phycisphaerae bacterium]|nr:sodium:proton antiporter [Phycisphaerae bacterium]
NRPHLKPYHIVFFIFIVANCGGALTPIGDPPLFMGFLKGIPFFWTARELWPMWALAMAMLLGIFFVIDEIDHRKARRTFTHDAGPGVSIFGFQNFIFIGLILVAVFQRSLFEWIDQKQYTRILLSREVLMLAAALASKLTTKQYIYEKNEFTWGPIREVAILFLGIFSTMVPALNWLAHNADRMPLKSPSQYYWVTGMLSSGLDNAPTYLVFLETSQAQVRARYSRQINELRRLAMDHRVGEVPRVPTSGDPLVINAYKVLVDYHRKKVAAARVSESDVRIATALASPNISMYLIAISLGAVFFGAVTYIGNGPNFMVKSIAEAQGVKMPSFVRYVLQYSVPFLFPVLITVWLVFFHFGLRI